MIFQLSPGLMASKASCIARQHGLVAISAWSPESKSQKTVIFHGFLALASGVPGAIRTRGLSLRRRMLYPAELRRHFGIRLLWNPGRGGAESGESGGDRLEKTAKTAPKPKPVYLNVLILSMIWTNKVAI